MIQYPSVALNIVDDRETGEQSRESRGKQVSAELGQYQADDGYTVNYVNNTNITSQHITMKILITITLLAVISCSQGASVNNTSENVSTTSEPTTVKTTVKTTEKIITTTTTTTTAKPNKPPKSLPTPKPIDDSHAFLFMTVFLFGLFGVLAFYTYKKSSGSLMNSRFQYSVLNTSLMPDHDDDNDPLMRDINRSAEDDDVNFLDMSRYQYSDDDDVELLGSDDVFLNMDAPTPSLVTTRTQVLDNQRQ